MLRISPSVLNDLARENGWLHERGRLAGTLNATVMAAKLGVSVSTVTRAYDSGVLGTVLLSRLKTITDRSLDELVEVGEREQVKAP